MFKDHFCPTFVFGGLFTVISNVCAFEVTHFWICVLRADDVVAKLASRFEFCQIGRKLMSRLAMVFRLPMIAVQLTLLL